MSKGLEKLRDDFEDQVKVLKTYDRESYEVIEVATQVAQALKDVFGVDVSSDFVLDNLDKIEKAVAGDVEAFKELEILAAKDYVAHLAISDEYKEQLTGALDYLNALPDVQIGMNAVLDQSYTE
jgi:hypothetical protein